MVLQVITVYYARYIYVEKWNEYDFIIKHIHQMYLQFSFIQKYLLKVNVEFFMEQIIFIENLCISQTGDIFQL